MLALPDTQACVMDALLGRSDGAAAAALLRSNSVLTTRQRLQVYRNNVHQSLIAALGAVYPVVARLVGEVFFRHMARAHIHAHPSRSGNLHDFGAELPAFLRVFAPATSHPYLSDVAMLEWAYHRAYHAIEQPALEAACLAQVPVADQADLRFELQPCARFVSSLYPVLKIWQANQTPEDDTIVSLNEGGVNLLVVQHDLEIEFRLLGKAESRWLCALANGATLGEATQDALDADAAFDLATTLARHFHLGLFTGMTLPRQRARRTT